jgi:hypothetical protein
MKKFPAQLQHRNLILHWVGANNWYASRGYEIWRSADQGESWTNASVLKHDWKRWAARFPLLAQIGRLGIQNMIGLADEALLCVADGVLYRSIDQGTTFDPVLTSFHGRRPLRKGICLDQAGRIYLGEYWVNNEREAVRLWRSDDAGESWQIAHQWPPGTIRHLHFVQFDPVAQALWVGTGDDDSECHIAYSRDGGDTFTPIGQGSQLWRAVSLMFTPDALYWGMDAGVDAEDQINYLVRWDRRTQKLESLQEIAGPAYYSTQLADDILVLGTAVEGGRNEKDKRTHLYWSVNGDEWHDIQLWPKWPAPEILGHAILTFPLSEKPLKRLLLNGHFIRSWNNGALFEIGLH